jgi:D-threo-aldose 1-dehydrogenase
MLLPVENRRAVGGNGIRMPSVLFGTSAFANLPQVIPEQRKLAIVGEWLRSVAPPIFIDVDYIRGNDLALEALSRIFRRLDVRPDEVIINLTLASARSAELWNKSCRLLGDEYRPRLLSVVDADDGASPTLSELKASGKVDGIGIVAKDWRKLTSIASPIDWVLLSQGLSVMQHPAEMLSVMAEVAQRDISIIVRGVFGGGFLVGGNCLEGRVLNSGDPGNRSLFAWRTAFVALCHGHGISPAHACIQFALSAPGVVAVELNSSYPDRVAENIESVTTKVPVAFWTSMKEEGLLSADYPDLPA